MPFELDRVETITVDSYGTLVDPSSIHDTLSDYVTEPTLVSNVWFSRALLNKLVANFIGAYVPFDVLSRDGLDFALEAQGVELTDEERERILAAYNKLDVFEGVESGIRRIHEQGYDVYVISNGTEAMLEALVERTGIDDIISDTISADEIKTYKPDAEIYRHAAARAGTSIDEILHVSGPYFDVLGAMHAGMQGGWINYGRPRDTFAGGPDIEVSSFEELADILSEAGSA
jgi:2-haloacid dehalogenase